MSKIHYMELVNENPDSDDTMSLIAEDIIDKLGSTVQDGWVVIVGDGKTYQHLRNIKQMYSGAFQKLLIFPGDWHILKNFQPVLMKLYYHAGLKELAQASGFQGATLKSLETSGNFKRTHNLLLQAWEALYRVMWNVYLTKHELNDLIESARCIISASVENAQTPNHLMQRIKELLRDSNIQKSFEEFVMKQEDQTWKLWVQFLFHDCFSYIGLYLAIRGCNWKLRVSCLKLMSPLFAVLDCSTYERIIPNHLADIQQYPSDILQCLASGGFTVNVTGHSWHAVALDEAHEMCINKDLKAAVVHPTQAYLQKTTLFLNNRIKAYKNLTQQLFPGRTDEDLGKNDIIDCTPNGKHQEDNIEQMCSVISSKKLFDLQLNRGIVNVFSGQKATEEQATDMLSCHKIGTESFHNYIKYHILKQRSTNAPLRKHRLLTMASPKPKRHRVSAQEKETKQVIQCLRRKLAWCKYNAQPDALDNDQYSVLPRAIADEEGYPHKGTKSRWTDKLESRYKSAKPTVFTNFPLWTPEVVIIDAMFLINIRPLRRTKTVAEYASLLFNQAVVQYYKAGTNEIHLVFDKPGRQTFNPKACEHHRRYSKGNTTSQHHHCSFTPDSTIPSRWQDHLECRECKRSIVEAIGLSFLQQGRSLLRGTQKLVLSGCFSGENENDAWSLSPNESVPELTVLYHSNAEESDNRMWRHAYQSWATRILIYSPDTDTYNIGLGLVGDTTKQFIIQLNVLHASEKRYLSLNNLHMALLNDPDLAMLPRNSISETLQVLFISTGCDFISFFKTLGKVTILNNFFQNSNFIGCLNKVLMDNKEEGFLAFILSPHKWSGHKWSSWTNYVEHKWSPKPFMFS